MSSESKDNAEDELASWKRERERRKRERQKQRQQDGSGNKDDFDFLAQGMVELDEASNNGNDDEVPFVPLAKRKRLEKEVLIGGMAHRRRHIGLVNTEDENGSGADTNHNHGTEAGGSENNEDSNQVSDGDDEGTTSDPKKVESLLESASALQESLTEEERAEKLRKEEEARILKEASKVQTNALQAASELAKGIQYTSPMPSTWTCPRYIIEQGEESWEKIRKEWHMEVEGVDVPPPCKRFVDMKFAPPILEVLKRKGIKKPTPIQMQGLTVVRIMIQKQFSTIVVCFAHIVMFTISPLIVALSCTKKYLQWLQALAGRDLIGIAFTGSGKTLTFGLPLVTIALEEELRMPLLPGEGPVGIILAPSRELVRQTYEVVTEFCDEISKTPGYPELRTQLIIGGESVKDQLMTLQTQGIHSVIATPGRLRDILKRKAMKLDNCRFIALDEADRLLDLGFDEELGDIMNNFSHQRQNLLFSVSFSVEIDMVFSFNLSIKSSRLIRRAVHSSIATVLVGNVP